jgi:hypothetical protein
MKKLFTIILCVLAWISAGAASSVTIDGIRYTLRKNNTLSCRAVNKDALVNVELPQTVRVDGFDYQVGSIEIEGFRNCNNLKSITIPNSVKKIGRCAFSDCKELESVVMPDDGKAEIFSGYYGSGRVGIFKGCVKLSKVSGHDLPYPGYVIFDAFCNCDDTPFYATILKEGSANLASRTYPKKEQPATVIIREQTATAPNPAAKTFTPDAVDLDIPVSQQTNDRTFALIIGNENYKRVAPVDFADNDAQTFGRYCELTLGVPRSNIRTYIDATYGDMVAAINDIKSIAEVYDGNIKVIAYYAGHGVPDENSRNAYLLPVDATGSDTNTCYPLNKFYEELGSLNAKQVIAFIDACFSGSTRGDGMLTSARGVRLRPRDLEASGNMVILTAASGNQSALAYDTKGHGIFTYYLLNKLRETGGNVSIGELADYVSTEVARQSIVVNRKLQLPAVNFAPSLHSQWRELKLK